MKRKNLAILRRLFIWLTVIMMLMGSGISAALATPTEGGSTVEGTGEEGTLTPPDYSYEDGNVILHKQAVRTGETEWTVNVKVTIGKQPVQKRQMEVVMLMDLSSSMRTNEVEDHKHTDACSVLTCDVHTEHNDSCYTQGLTCTTPEHAHTDDCWNDSFHVHSLANGCYEECTERYHSYLNDNLHARAGCTKINSTWYTLVCTKEEHTAHTDACCKYGLVAHAHTDGCYGPVLDCKLDFVENHTHGLGCYHCPYYGFKDVANPNQWGNNENEYILNGYATRLAVAAVAAERLLSSLPADSTKITRLGFNSQNSGLITGIDSYYDVNTNTGTYLWQAINLVLSGNYFSSDPNTKKVFVILNDGNANDSKGTTLDKVEAFKNNGGTVFTVGFADWDDMLGDIATKGGGEYMTATNASELIGVFDDLAETLTAMLEDPMGTSVEFEASDIQEIHTAGGTISSSGDTIYWHPAEEGDGTVANSTIEYTYTVNLSEQAETGVGTHDNVPLNKTTYFYYGTKSGDTTTMKAVEFPIPIADYSYSSVQTTWKAGNTIIDIDDLKAAAGNDQNPELPGNPTSVEKIIADTIEGVYIPQFKQSYDFMPAIIPISGSNDYYRYVDTTVTATSTDAAGNTTSTTLGGVSDVVATNPVAYQVVHNYQRVEASTLFLDGTKYMGGRDFTPGDEFIITLTGVPDEDDILPPMPSGANGNVKTVTINPTSGNAVAFSFGSIDFTQAGTYTYTIQEQQGTLDNVIYDTTPRTMVVTVADNNGELTATYKIDNVGNAALRIINRLQSGSLKVEKSEVDSYNSEHQDKLFGFQIYAENVSKRQITGTYEVEYTDVDGTQTSGTATFVNGYATVQLKAKQSVVIKGLPDGATYTVTEPKVGGFTATVTGDDTGTIEANVQKEVAFSNAYEAKGEYQFIGNKTLVDATLAEKQFTFVVTDETGAEVATGENLENGMIYFDFINFTHDDRGEKKYFIKEVIDNQSGILYDRTVHEVKLKITDKGDGTLSIEPVLAEGEKLDITFTNKHITGQLTVSKTVSGNMGNRYAKFPFTLTAEDLAGQTLNVSTDGGATFTTVTLDENGQTTFTLAHGQDIIFYPVSGAYTVTETANGSYTTTYSIDGGDAESGTVASGNISADGSASVAFNNHLEMSPPTGVDTPTSAALVGIVMAMALLAIVYIGRRWRILEE